MSPFLSPLTRLLMVAVGCLVLAGCQLWPFSDRTEEAPPEPSAAESAATGAETAADSNERAMTLLQEGEEEEAERMLSRILAERPEDATAKLLLAQIRQPPEQLLGESFEEIEVRPGDSLSAIAGRSIDNELLFYALAKLNNVAVPRLLRPGQMLLVPRLEPISPDMEEAEADEAADIQAAATLDDAELLQDTARRLIETERYRQAHALLLSAARAGKLQRPGDELLAEAAVALADAACSQDDPEQAMKILGQTSPWLGASAEEGEFVRQRNHVEARLSLGEVERALARGERESAFDALIDARELAADLRETHLHRLEQLETTLGAYYHDSALSAWRDQQVDLAIELWERVVRIDPDFEPAIRYLERARRAQQELESLEEG